MRIVDEIKELLHKPVVLIGVLGSGKSTIGRIFAKKIGLKFFDSDKIVEKREGMSVVDIYDYRGKDYFKQKEAEVIKELLDQGVIVISTGSGAFLNDDLHNLILHNTISVWLRADINILYERVIRRNTRPELMSGDKMEKLQQMIDEYHPIYAKANVIVESANSAPHYIVDELMIAVNKYLKSEQSGAQI